MEKYTVTIVNISTLNTSLLTVCADEAESSDDIIIEASIEGNTVRSCGNSYMEAYQIFRDRLLDLGYGIKCCGSLINAVQSGMMAYTPEVYLVTSGKQTLQKDIAGIWDYCDISEFPDSKAQNEFTENWFESLRK